MPSPALKAIPASLTPIVISGPTASGKTGIACQLRKLIPGGPLINCDSMQVYKGMNIGTAKVTLKEQKEFPHALIDVADPKEGFNVHRFIELALPLIDQQVEEGSRPILVGGTGMYLKALVEGFDLAGTPPDDELRDRIRAEIETGGADALYAELKAGDPDTAERTDPKNHHRLIRAVEVFRTRGKVEPGQITPAIPIRSFAPDWSRADLYERIERRVDSMIDRGLLDEVRLLLGNGVKADDPGMRALGYRQLAPVITRGNNLKAAIAEIKQKTRNFAKRQITWFRHQLEVEWIFMDHERDPADAAREIFERLSEDPRPDMPRF